MSADFLVLITNLLKLVLVYNSNTLRYTVFKRECPYKSNVLKYLGGGGNMFQRTFWT